MELDHHNYRTFCCTACGYDFKAPLRCGDRFCPVCSRASRNRVRARLRSLVNSQAPYPSYGFKHLTLSVTNNSDLTSAHRHLSAAFRRLRQRALWRRTVLGGCFVFEVAGRPGNWHLHIHAVLFAKYVPWSLLHSAWKQVSTGQAVYITSRPPAVVISYLTKYLTKSTLSAEIARAASAELPNLRLFTAFGGWHSINSKIPKLAAVCPKCGECSWMPLDLIEIGIRKGYYPRYPAHYTNHDRET